MRGVRFTKAELAHLRAVLAEPDPAGRAESILRKLDAACEPRDAGVDAGALERALVRHSRGKVIPLGAGALWDQLSRRATAAGVRVEDAPHVGAWLAAQSWYHGPSTLSEVLPKWASYLARARATVPPPLESDGQDLGQDPQAGRRPSTGGRRKAGL